MHLGAKAFSKIYGQEENRGVALDRASLAITPGGFISTMGINGEKRLKIAKSLE